MRRISNIRLYAAITDFNPRTPVGCDVAAFEAGRWRDISIHAPQWGATVKVDWPRLMLEFQSTHPSGVRHIRCVMLPVPSLFQSTHPSGVRREWCGLGTNAIDISIHAPQWGATHRFRPSAPRNPYFNPRTPVGCDAINHAIPQHATIGFQSTHPSGVRRKNNEKLNADNDFNPRTPVGCDAPFSTICATASVFQSTHPSGVRPSANLFSVIRRNFNPRTPVGCDHIHRIVQPQQGISIHAPQWGATLAAYAAQGDYQFQSTHPSGVRPTIITGNSRRAGFQSTHPSGVRPREWA